MSIAKLAYDAGVRGQANLQAATAIALAESGGNPNAVGDVGLENNTWGPSLGLWQIRSQKAATNSGSARDMSRLKDPAFNAKSMFSISNGGKNWGPWSTWPVRAALFMPTAAAAAATVNTGGAVADTASGVTAGVTDTAASLADVGAGIRASYAWVSNRNNWFRVAKVGIGATVLVVAIGAIARNTETGKAVIDTSAKFAGAATKAAAAA